MPYLPPYQASTQLLQPTIFLQQRANMTGSDRRVADVAFECITQFTVEGNWDLCKSISKRCCNSRIRITSSVRDARPEVTVHFLTGMKSSSESEALVSWD